MKKYLRNWNFMRILRLAIGIFIIVQGIIMKEWMFTGLGILFTLMPVFNVGCGASGSCNRPFTRTYRSYDSGENVSYEDVK